jgi:hypothetical protein
MRNWSHGITVGIGLGLALAGACKEDDGTGEVPADDAPQRVAGEFCAAYFACDCGDFVDRYDSEADCKTEIAEALQDDIDAGNQAGLTYHDDCPGLWIDAIGTLDCKTGIEVALDQASVEALVDITECKLFYGTAAAGEACETDAESNSDDCLPDLLCTNGICAVRTEGVAQGESCEPQDNECDAGLFCADIDGDSESVCERLPVGGETCLGALDLCDVDFFCDQASKTCVTLPGIGDDCAPVGTLRCSAGAQCSADDDTCIAAPGAGEPCNGVCDVGLVCESEVCAKAQAALCGGFANND